MNRVGLVIDSQLESIIDYFDRARQHMLKKSLQNLWLRKIYLSYEMRMIVGLLMTTLIALPTAILRPDLLLALGPLIFGYPHLIASFRYLSIREKSKIKLRPKLFFLFSVLTIFVIFFYKTRFSFEFVSFAFWPQVMALLALIFVYAAGYHKGQIGFIFGTFLALGCVLCAWHKPLLFTGAFLIAHNFIAFLHWCVSAKIQRRRQIAMAGTLCFVLLHGFVLWGGLDPWLNTDILKTYKVDHTGWLLASWSKEPIIWYRWLVLYTYGLSIHYFVWLRAIPESELKSNYPLSFRMSLKEWRQDLGSTWLKLSVIMALVGLSIWLLDAKLGQHLYFQIALLHGSLELVFWPTKLFTLEVNK